MGNAFGDVVYAEIKILPGVGWRCRVAGPPGRRAENVSGVVCTEIRCTP